MDHFSFLIDDVRYTVPNLLLILVTDVDRAKELAVQKLLEAPEHLSVQVFQGDRLICTISRDNAASISQMNGGKGADTLLALQRFDEKRRIFSR
ncbi:MAG TPA: hypothetical protein VGI79_09895 [Caulobacteraceae bacterium]|jgi:hypothetical protein